MVRSRPDGAKIKKRPAEQPKKPPHATETRRKPKKRPAEHAKAREAEPAPAPAETSTLAAEASEDELHFKAKKPKHAFRSKVDPKAPLQRRLLQEIHEMQNTTHLLIPKRSFQQLVKDILKEFEKKEDELRRMKFKEELHTHLPEDRDLARSRVGIRMETTALLALHEAAEMYLVGILEDGNLCAVHNKRVTLMPRDMSLVGRLRRVKLKEDGDNHQSEQGDSPA